MLLSGALLIGVGTLQTLSVGPVWDLTARFYSAHYPELIGFMRSRAEPVTTSATHSVAACVYAVVSLTASMLSSRVAPRRMVFALRAVSDEQQPH